MTTQTNYMRADEIAHSFNAVDERQYWRASIAGTRLKPEVNFNSRSSMVTITYRIATSDFTVSFSKSAVAFGDYMASTYRSMAQILAALKAAGLPFAEPLEDAALWIEYDPKSKDTVCGVVRHGDVWANAVPMVFKVPVRPPVSEAFTITAEPSEIPLDDPSTGN